MLPGMGADARLFGPQLTAGLAFEAPELPDPYPSDTLSTYAQRIRDRLRLEEPCVVGGVSFGGMIAYELARITHAQQVLLIASCTDRQAIPGYFRQVERVSRLVPDFLLRWRAAITSRVAAQIEGLTREQHQLIREMAKDVGIPVLRRIARMILTWEAPAECPCPVHHIHGGRDMLIPLKNVNPEAVIPTGGHLINLTHPEEVNAFLWRYLNG